MSFAYRVARKEEEALDLLREYGDEARVMAGGTALVLMLKQRLLVPDVVIDLARVPGLDGIELVRGELRLGSLLTHRAAEMAPKLLERVPVLAETYRRVGTIRIRNLATVGGSLAHADPNQDPPVTLLALDARVTLASAAGRRQVPLESFFVDYYETVLEPQELVTAIHVPLPGDDTGVVYQKFLPRSADDYATVAVAAAVRIDRETGACTDCRIALGCLGPTPFRARTSEDLIRGQTLDGALLREAAVAAQEATDPISDTRGTADYKRSMAGVFVRRALEAAWRQALEAA